jgi:hypothetical protein
MRMIVPLALIFAEPELTSVDRCTTFMAYGSYTVRSPYKEARRVA